MQKTNLPEWLTPSVIILLLANLIPVYGVFFLGWEVFLVILIFWAENVIVGILNVARMLLVSPKDPLKWLAKLFLIPFFCFHYGMFTAVHGLFVVILFGRELIKTSSTGLPDISLVLSILREYYFVYAVLAFVASHGFSFFWNYIRKGEFKRASLASLMTQPYARILSGFLVLALNLPVAGLFLLLILKVRMDIAAHVKEHRKLGSTRNHEQKTAELPEA